MATNPVTPDPETMPLEELRKIAQAEAEKQSTTTTQTVTPSQEEEEEQQEEQKTTQQTTEEEEEEEEQQREFVAQRSFDLGDGAGSQVYKGHGATREEALEDLSNKLIEAQKNATKRIKELKGKTPEATVSKEDAALLAAEIVQNPVAAVEKILKMKGIDPDSLKESTEFVKTQKEVTKKRTAADSFVAAHPDYVDSERNGKLINKWCELHNDFSLDGMNKAFQDLNESGLLQVKGEEAGQGQEEQKSGTRTEETTQANSTRATRKASGISTHRRTPVNVNTTPSEDELNAMPLDKLRQLANKQLAG